MTSPDQGPSILVLASTFPAHPEDPVPGFVRDQVIALAKEYPELRLSVLAPHDRRSQTQSVTVHPSYTEYRFHYAWPRALEQLTGRGIMPSLRERPWLYAIIPWLFVAEFWAALRLVRKERPALLYAHWFTPQAIVCSWVSALTGVPFVFTTHAADVVAWRRVPWLGPRLVRRVTRRAEGATAVSRRSMEKLTSFFAPDAVQVPTRIVPMGVDLPPGVPSSGERLKARERLSLPPAGTTLLFIGRLVEKKGLAYLLTALAEDEGALESWTLLIAGDGPLRAELEALTKRLGLSDRVRFLGYVTGEAKADCLTAADVLVVPSVVAADGDAEGLPVTLLEGLAHGLVCVATRESGADDVLTDGVDGFLCGQMDSSGLRDTLERARGLTAEEHAALVAAALRLASRFAWPAVARAHYEFLFEPVLRP